MRNGKVQRIALSGILTSLMLVFGFIERQFPLPVPIPGIKLGLANSVLLYALYMMGIRQTIVLMLLKVLMSWLIYMNMSAMLYSFAGSVLSVAAMILLSRMNGVSIVGVGALGAVFFNVGQMLMAAWVLGTPQLIVTYLPVLVVSGVLTGVLSRLIEHGATVVVIEHDLDMIANADYVIDMGPGGGDAGGRIVAAGTPEEVAASPESVTGRYLAETLRPQSVK